MANDRIGGIIFFENINTETIALASSSNNLAKYSRFTGVAKSDRLDRN